MCGLCCELNQSRGNSLSTHSLKFLADQDVYEVTVKFLEQHGCEVLRARDAGLAQASDEALLSFASHTKQVLLTRDKGFGQIAFLLDLPLLGSSFCVLRLQHLKPFIKNFIKNFFASLKSTDTKTLYQFQKLCNITVCLMGNPYRKTTRLTT